MTVAGASTLLTYAAMAVFLIVCGASLFEHAALATSWAADPPASLQMFHGNHGVQPPRFFRVVQPLLAVLLVAALALSWKNPERRNLLLIAGGGYLVALITTGLYFVPELTSVVMGTPAITTEEWRSRALTWEKLALVRTLWILVFAIPLMMATRADVDQRRSFNIHSAFFAPSMGTSRSISVWTPMTAQTSMSAVPSAERSSRTARFFCERFVARERRAIVSSTSATYCLRIAGERAQASSS
jgi:hypothetical protein